ncbi:hypothetical protein BJX99DRAFT_269006 [Aspergillus californicus]
MGESQPEAYLLGRDAEESARLNNQHDFLLKVSGNDLIHPSIPIDSIESIADIATGTGIWIKEVSSFLSTRKPRVPSPQYYIHGFDISSAQFQHVPTQKETEIHLSVHNCLEPFPSEHHGRYDFVHVRLLLGALKIEEYEHALKNILDILKPNGYFQWEEIHMSSIDFDVSPRPPSINEINRLIVGAMNKSGLCIIPAKHIKKEAQRVGFDDLYIEEYDSDSKPQLRDSSRAWVIHASKSLVPMSMLRVGEETDEAIAKEKTEKLVAEVERECAGAAALVKLNCVIGRKPNSV